ncbi:MAG: ATPase [Prevotella sp.]|nr:ATPase [Prevotella sp.]
MKLIADSGSTKTDWALVNDEGSVLFLHTQGINPIHQDEAAITAILTGELLPQLGGATVSQLFFYGSGVRPTEQPLMQRLLAQATGAQTVEAHGDLLGAARALCGDAEGVACILGTGANSCLYDGCRIVMNTPPLGYILGDEGSGAVLGITLLNALYKGILPEGLRQEFEAQYSLTLTDVIDRVYRQPMANRFLASLSPFVHAHLQEPAVSDLVVGHFRRFFARNLSAYGRSDLPVSAVGSLAFYYGQQLRQAALAEGYELGRIERSPISALVAYHRQH